MIKIAFSFDDGRRDNYRVYNEILCPLGIPATFNVTVGYLLKDIAETDMPGQHEPMTIDELKKIGENLLFEIAGHGYRHNNDINNLIEGVKALKELIPSIRNKKIGIASPQSKIKDRSIEKIEKLGDVLYLRISNRRSEMTLFKRIIRKLNRLIKVPCLYYYVNKSSILRTNDQFLIYSVPILKDNSLKEVKYFIDRLSKCEEGKCVFMFHSILKRGEPFYRDLFTWDYDDFYELCKYIHDKKNIKFVTTRELILGDKNNAR